MLEFYEDPDISKAYLVLENAVDDAYDNYDGDDYDNSGDDYADDYNDYDGFNDDYDDDYYSD